MRKILPYICALLGVLLLGTGVSAAQASGQSSGQSAWPLRSILASDGLNPQLRPADNAAVPDRCVQQAPTTPGPAGGAYFKGYNAANSVTSTSWRLLKCTTLRVKVQRGEVHSASLVFVGEFDADGVDGNLGWAEPRFFISAVPFSPHVPGVARVSSIEPDNGGRSDGYALDSASGGSFDWSAHTLSQFATLTCGSAAPQPYCQFDVFVQARLTNGSSALWYDDTTTEVVVRDQTYWGEARRSLVAP